MTLASQKQLLATWFKLLALTIAAVAALHWIGNVTGLLLVLLFALFKGRLVILDFMGMRKHMAMRRALAGWCLLPVGATIFKLIFAII